MKHQPFLTWPDKHELLFPAAYELGDRHAAALVHSISQQSIRLLPSFLSSEMMGVFEIDGIHGSKGDELFQIDARVRFSFEAFEFLFRDRDVLILGMLKAANEVFTLNNHVAHWAIVLIAHARAAFVVQQVKGDVLALGRGMDRDGIATSPNDTTPVPGGGMYLSSRKLGGRNIPVF